MNLAVTIAIDALSYASWLFIVALGLTLVFGVLKILNIAHGSFYALGAYAAASFVAWFAAWKFAPGWSLVAMLLAAVVVAALVAPLTERGLLRFFYGRDEVLLVLVGIAVVVGAAVWWGLNRTRRGKIVLAVIHSEEVAASMGVDVSRVYMAAFSIGIFLAALGGAFTAPMISVAPGVSVGVIIVSFAVVIIGGLGSIEGAAVGALIVGLARSLAVHLAPVAELFSIYIVMALVLMVRPEGLFQQTQARKI